MAKATETSWALLALEAVGGPGRQAGGARRVVIEVLAGERCCLSAQQILERLRGRGARTGIASVYRALDLLHQARLVQRIEVGEGGARYEAVVPGGEHHHHAVCESCGRITPFDDPRLERAIDALAGRLRHRVRGHDVVIHGQCPRCARRPAVEA